MPIIARLIDGRARWLVMTAENIDAPRAPSLGPRYVVAPQRAWTTRSEHTVKALLECGPERCVRRRRCCGNGRAAAEGIRHLSVGVFVHPS